MKRVVLLAVLCALACAPSAYAQFDPAYEQRNYSKIDERPKRDTADAAFQAQLAQVSVDNEAYVNGVRVDDPERDPYANLCAHKGNGCAGDIRLYDWNPKYGLARRVLFTNRAGATLAGHVWMTRSGPAKRPGIVITNGSVQAPEELYWFAATTLAKRGYVVLTFDPQGQGYSDTRGEGGDANEGFPAQSGRPFFDGTEDALDFFLSTPAKPYVPRKSCTTGTSHTPSSSGACARASMTPTTPSSPPSTRRASGSPGTRSARRACRSSARATHGSRRSSPGTTSRRRAPAPRRARRARRRGRRRRSPSPRSA